jgi:hypothetical protein
VLEENKDRFWQIVGVVGVVDIMANVLLFEHYPFRRTKP